MRNHPVLKVSSLIGAILIISIFMSSCAAATPVIPADLPVLEPEPQSEVGVPGGLMVLPDGMGTEYPALVFDFEIQSRLITSGEYQECVDAGVCEPGPEALHEYAPAGVSWYQAQAYCSYLGGRLPTEAELTRATGGNEDCPETGGSLIDQEGFGEWVYDWDDPNYYDGSLSTNPFGPLYGDLKVAMGLDTDAILEVMYKYFGKYDGAEEFAKYDGSYVFGKVEDKVSGKVEDTSGKIDDEVAGKIDDTAGKIDDAAGKIEEGMSFGKIDELKFYYKIDQSVTIKVENGKISIKMGVADHDKWDSGEGDLYPRMGVIPESANPLIGFRCVTEGAALSYAPICKSQTAAKCSLPSASLESIALQLDSAVSIDPNLQIIGANCPQDDQFALTLSHDLPSAEGAEIKASEKTCQCQEYPDYPGQLYCNCPSPGAGSKTEIEFCASAQEPTLISMNDLCPEGSTLDLLAGGCTRNNNQTPVVYSLPAADRGESASACPGGPGLPVPTSGSLGAAAAGFGEIAEIEIPDGNPWDLFSVSDGSGMCPPGYTYNPDTSCCSPMSGDNYDCGPDEYFDAGTRRCLPLGWDGCGPCQRMNSDGLCAYDDKSSFSGMRCNTDSDEMERDDYGRPTEDPGSCQSGSYLDADSGRCVETRDGCALGSYLDPKTGSCRPTTGLESPCQEGQIYNPLSGCCVPSPGTEDSECPEGTEFDGTICRSIMGGCPPTHLYDEDSDSCLLLMGGECPAGTKSDLFGSCIPDIPGECPDGREYEPISGACPPDPPDPATCVGDKVFDASTGFCGYPPPPNTRQRGETDLGDIITIPEEGDAAPDIAESIAGGPGEISFMPVMIGLGWVLESEPGEGQYSGGGMGSGKCELSDLEVTKQAGRDTPDLFVTCSDPDTVDTPLSTPLESPDSILSCLMLTANKTIRSGLGFCQQAGDGDEITEQFFTVEFEEGRIASITRVSPDEIEPATAEEPATEEVTFCFGYVFGADVETGKEPDDEDDSSEPVSGIMPEASACTPNLMIDAGAIFESGDCSRLTTTVPYCAVQDITDGGSSAPLICKGLPQNPCLATSGCGWTGSSCIKCKGLDQGTCQNIQGCVWDGNQCGP